MSGPCTDCGGPDYQTLVAHVAELEAEGASRYKAGYEAAKRDGRIRVTNLEAERDKYKWQRDEALVALTPIDDGETDNTSTLQRDIDRGRVSLESLDGDWTAREAVTP